MAFNAAGGSKLPLQLPIVFVKIHKETPMLIVFCIAMAALLGFALGFKQSRDFWQKAPMPILTRS
jgi:hypothetical protein